MKNEAVNIHLEYEWQGWREVIFTDLMAAVVLHNAYAPERRVFDPLGMDAEIADGVLSRALAARPTDRRAIILLAYPLEMPDAEIAQHLGLNRSMVQYRRTSTLEQLRKRMEE